MQFQIGGADDVVQFGTQHTAGDDRRPCLAWFEENLFAGPVKLRSSGALGGPHVTYPEPLCFDNALHNCATTIHQIVHWALSKGNQIHIIATRNRMLWLGLG